MRYLIIGSGIAGLTALENIRKNDPEGEIILISEEKELPYSRPMLSKAPLLSMDLKPLKIHDRSWYEGNRIELIRGVRAQKIDTDRKLVHLGSDQIGYDKCIIANGASNFIPPFPGREDAEICDIRTIEDLRHVRRLAVPGGEAVVIGGGVIGLEMAAEIRRFGMKVTVLEAMDRLMPRLIDERTSEILKKRLPFEVFTGVNITGLKRSGDRTVIEDASGIRRECDLLIVSCGVRANTALAQASGISCGRGITVNDRMETDAPDVYACGDCAEHKGFNVALWSQAVVQGEVAGKNASGIDAVYKGCDTSLMMMMDDLGLFALGDLGQSGEGYVIEENEWEPDPGFLVDPRRPHKFGYSRKVYRDGRLTGAVLLGDLTGMNEIKTELLGR